MGLLRVLAEEEENHSLCPIVGHEMSGNRTPGVPLALTPGILNRPLGRTSRLVLARSSLGFRPLGLAERTGSHIVTSKVAATPGPARA